MPRTIPDSGRRDWVDRAAQAGLVAYGVVHLLIGWLAVQLALGSSDGSASNSGAMRQVAEQPFGGVLIWVLALGLVLLVVWQGFEAVVEADEVKDRAKCAAKAVVFCALAVTAVRTATGNSGGGGTDSLTGRLMSAPGGQLLVGAVGLGIVGYGGYLVYKGWTERFRKELEGSGQSGQEGRAIIRIGKVGHIAKGVAIGVVGLLFCYAALTHDPDKSGGLDQALQTIREQPFGQVLLVAVGLGIAAYGVYSFARARHLSR